MADHLFVYGTLRSDSCHPARRLLADQAEFVGTARLQARLFQVAEYPGAVGSADPAETVHGELYQWSGRGDLLERLDGYEGCGPEDLEPTEFVRRRCPVRRADGAVTEAWVYLYNRPTDGLRRLS